MNQPKTSAKPLVCNIFKDISTLTLAECIDNIFFMKYLLYKEANALLREKYQYYIGQLSDRFQQLEDQEAACNLMEENRSAI